ncbi:response regulator [Desulfosarcina sp. OttesenSCG-928-G10]|nr:response regulator [Desulfosarcina sp. OttesenSCG-928-G10]
MTQDKNDFLAEYVEEVQTYVPIMQAAIGDLRKNPFKRDAQEELHRLTHIIHGASAMIGIRTLNRIAGCMEETLEQVLEGRRIDEATLTAMAATVERIEIYCQSLQQGLSVDEEQLISLTEADFRQLDADMDALFALDPMQEPILDDADLFATVPDPRPDTEPAAEPEEDLETLYQSLQDVKTPDPDTDAMFSLDSIAEPILDAADPFATVSDPRPEAELLTEPEDDLENLYQSLQDVKMLDSDVDAMFSLDAIQEPIIDTADPFVAVSDPQLDTALWTEPEADLESLHQSLQDIKTLDADVDAMFSLEATPAPPSDMEMMTEPEDGPAPPHQSPQDIRTLDADVNAMFSLDAIEDPVTDTADPFITVSDPSSDMEMMTEPEDDPETLHQSLQDAKALDADVNAMFSLDAIEDPVIDTADPFVTLSGSDPESIDLGPDNKSRVDGTDKARSEILDPIAAPEEAAEAVSSTGSMSDSLFSEEEKQILHAGFREEAEEHFQQLNASIQILSAEIDGRVVADAQQKEEVRKVRRAVHTIKGASAVIGLQNIATYAHGVEDFLDWLYEDTQHHDPERVENLANALDHLSLLVESPESVAADRGADLLQRLLKISREDKPEDAKPEAPAPEVSITDALSDIPAVAPAEPEADAKPDEGIQTVPDQTDSIPWQADAELEVDLVETPSDEKAYGRRWTDAEPETDPVEAPSDGKASGQRWVDAEPEAGLVEASSGNQGYGRRKDDAEVVSATEASRTLRIHQGQMDTLINLANELLVGISGFDQNMNLFKKALEEMELASRRLKGIALELETKFEVKALDQLSQHFLHLDQTMADIKASQSFSEFDALELDRYTQLNLIIRSLNESAIDMAAIHTHLDGVYSGIGGDISRQHRVVREMQIQMLRTRMSPISTLSPRLNRTLRDVASRLGKRARLVIEGEQVELDRMILEKLADPFMHLVRNAIHHGIESPSERQARKKPAVATLTLAARREGNHMVIRFSDDGQGLDFDAIRKKARRSGLKDTVDQMNAEQLTELIFYSGFSTKAISEISGRGVGMDVVRENIKGLQGTVSVETQPGTGTTFVIRIPITLGVVRALLIKIGAVTYGIALDDIKDIHRLEPGSISFTEGTCRVAGETLPWHSLTALLGFAGHEPDEDLSLVLNMFAGKGTLALSIPHITGQKELVIKGVGPHLRSVPGVSGAAVMGDGSIVPVLNIPDLVQAASRAEHHHAFSLSLETPSAFTVMIVDDSISIRRVMSRLVTHNGWDPVEAKDGLDAVEQLEHGEVRPDVIMLDIEMPRMNGFEFLAKLPHIPGGKDIPVIMLTSRTSDKHQEKAMQLGAKAFLNKPVKDEELADTVRRLTGHSNVSAPESEGRVLA